MDIRKQVGKNFARVRKQKGLSQEELSFDTGLHRTYISGIERGARNPTIIILDKIAKALKVTPRSLLE